MKIKYAVVLIFMVALVIIKKESNILSRVCDEVMERQTPQQTTQSSLNSSTVIPKNLSVLNMLCSKGKSAEERTDERHEEELQNGGHKNILLMATTRSGSSFIGQMFNQHGENMFYLFEPLWHVLHMPNRTNDSGLLAGNYRDVLQGLFLCDFSPLEKFLFPPPKEHVAAWLFRRHSSLSLCDKPVCTPIIKEVFERYRCENQKCAPLNLTLASQSCLSKQFHVIKTVRVEKWETLRPLVEDPRLNIKIIQLVRDPRAIFASRMVAFSEYHMWKSLMQDGQVPEDNEVVQGLKGNCEHIRRLAELGLSQPRWLRRRYMLVRYEDVARNPMQKAEEMYRFTGIPFSHEAREWILRNTQTTLDVNVFSTQRNSSEQVDKWRYSIPFALAQMVQRLCGPTMKLFGYKSVDDAKTLVNKSISLFEDKRFH